MIKGSYVIARNKGQYLQWERIDKMISTMVKYTSENYTKSKNNKVSSGRIPPDGSYVGSSSCNDYTDKLGAGQKVLSYSYYTPGE